CIERVFEDCPEPLLALPQRIFRPFALRVVVSITLGLDQFAIRAETPDHVLHDMDTGAVPALPDPALVLDLPLHPEARDEPVTISGVFVEVPDIGVQRFFYRSKPEHPDERRVAGEYPAVGGGKVISGEIALKEPPVALLTLLQGILYRLQRGVLAPKRFVLGQEFFHAFIDRPF